MKCDFCPDMVRDGTLPYCVQACPNRAIYYGDLEEDIAGQSRGIAVRHEADKTVADVNHIQNSAHRHQGVHDLSEQITAYDHACILKI